MSLSTAEKSVMFNLAKSLIRRPVWSKKMAPRFASVRLEPLESRYAPASMVSSTKLSYRDADGDSVAVTFSKPILNAGNVNDVFQFDVGDAKSGNAAPQQLQKIILKG